MASAAAVIIAAPPQAAAAAGQRFGGGRDGRYAGAGGTTSTCPGSVGLGITGTCGTPGPFPTIRSCRRNSVYLKEPTICCQLYRLGPCSPGSPPKPISGIDPRISRSMLTRVEIAATRGRFDERWHQPVEREQRGVGGQRDVIPRAGDPVGIGDDASPAGVGARDRRELASCSLVSPICSTRSAIWVVWAASVSVAGPASAISSPSGRSWTRSDRRARDVSVSAVEISSERALSVPSVWLVLRIRSPKA